MLAFLDALCAALLARHSIEIYRLLALPQARQLPRNVREEATVIAKAGPTSHLAPIQALMTGHRTRLLLKLVFGNAGFTFLAISAVLALKRTDLVPWAMVVAQLVLMVSAWTCFPRRTYFVREDGRNLVLPAILMTAPLFFGAGRFPPPIVFALSAFGYAGGLALVRIWRRPWMEAIIRG